MKRCPQCGFTWYDGGWEEYTRRQLFLGAGQADDMTEYQKIEPRRRPTVEGNFMTPALQSVTTGFIAALVAGFIAATTRQPLSTGVIVFFGAGIIITALAWLGSLRYFNSLLVTRETMRRDPYAGVELPKKETVEVVIHQGQTTYISEWPIPIASLRQVARMVNNGMPFTYRSLVGHNKPLTRNQWDALIKELFDREMIAYKDEANPQMGIDILPAGTALLNELDSRASQRSAHARTAHAQGKMNVRNG